MNSLLSSGVRICGCLCTYQNRDQKTLVQLFVGVKSSKPAPKAFKPECLLSQEDRSPVSESSAGEASSAFSAIIPCKEIGRKG